MGCAECLYFCFIECELKWALSAISTERTDTIVDDNPAVIAVTATTAATRNHAHRHDSANSPKQNVSRSFHWPVA